MLYCGFAGACAGGVVCPAVGVALFGFGAAFFFGAGFFGGSVSSTTIFFGGSAAVCAAFRSARSRVISASFVELRLSIRSASCFRPVSNVLRSFDSDCMSSFDPNAPAPSTTPPSTSYNASRLR